MIGGVVIGIVWRKDNTALLHLRDCLHSGCVDILAEQDKLVRLGDYVWLDADGAYWTPVGSAVQDIPLGRLGKLHHKGKVTAYERSA